MPIRSTKVAGAAPEATSDDAVEGWAFIEDAYLQAADWDPGDWKRVLAVWRHMVNQMPDHIRRDAAVQKAASRLAARLPAAPTAPTPSGRQTQAHQPTGTYDKEMTLNELGQNIWFLATRIARTKEARRPFYPAVVIWVSLMGWAGHNAPVAALTYWTAAVAGTAVAVLITLTIKGVVLGRYRQL